MSAHKRSQSAGPADARKGEFVPLWLVVAVLVLLAAVLGVAAYIVFGVIVPDRLSQSAEIGEWRKRVHDQPENVSAIMGLGYAYQRNGRYEAALREYRRVLELDPDNLGALYNQGVSWRERHEETKAEESFLKVVKLSPGHALACKALAEHYRDEDRYEAMLDILSNAVAANPQMADLHALYGLALEKTGNRNEALGEYESALSLDPDTPYAEEGIRRLKKDNE